MRCGPCRPSDELIRKFEIDGCASRRSVQLARAYGAARLTQTRDALLPTFISGELRVAPEAEEAE